MKNIKKKFIKCFKKGKIIVGSYSDIHDRIEKEGLRKGYVYHPQEQQNENN